MHAFKKAIDRIRQTLRFKYYAIRMSRPVWLHLINREGRRLFRADALPPLGPAEERILNDLRQNGIAFAHITDIISEAEWQELRAYLALRLKDPAIAAQMSGPRDPTADAKYYNVDLLDQKTLDLGHVTTKWALNEKILDIASRYMGMYTRFRGARLWASLPVPDGARAQASQLWHRDLDDRQLMKTFVYFEDVDETAGPFHYVRESHYAGRWNKLFPTPFPLGSYPPDGAVDRAVPAEYVVKATGKAGTLIFCDTSGFHKGGYCTRKNRYMLFNLYTSNASKHEKLAYEYPRDFSMRSLSPRAVYAVTNEGMPETS